MRQDTHAQSHLHFLCQVWHGSQAVTSFEPVCTSDCVENETEAGGKGGKV
jgi:hypothetical protein